MFKKTIIYLFSFFICQNGVWSAINFDHPLGIAELVDIALENNPETRQTWWHAKRAAAQLGSARSAYYPVVGVDADVANGRDFKFINGPDADYTIVGANLTLSWLLYDFGERDANVEAAKKALLAVNWQSDWVLQSVLIRVLENAYSTLHLQAVLEAAIVSSEDALLMLKAAQQLNEAGLTPITDVYTSQSQYSQIMMDVIQQKASLGIEKGKLASSLGLNAVTDLALMPLHQIPFPQKQNLSDLIVLALQQRSDLMAKQARLAESRALQKKIRLSYRPKISLNTRVGANHSIHDKANAAQYQVRLNVDVPLFDGFDHIYRNRAAYADTQISTEELIQLELDIALEVLTYSKNLEAAQEMIAYADDNLKNAQRAYEGVLEKYRAGKEGIAEISNALRQLASARVRYSEIRTKLLVAAANLAYATGTLLPYGEIPCKKSL